jgi:hypothetical protein
MPPTPSRTVVLQQLLDPLSGERVDLELDCPTLPGGATLDASDWWLLPAVYDADVHWPVFDHGVRELDRFHALKGGAVSVNTACPWDRVAAVGPAAVGAALDPVRFPQVIPVLSVSPDETSAGFAAWLSTNRDELLETWPAVCKLYSYDERFEENLAAVVEAGMRPIIYAYDADAVDRIVAMGTPVHFRHAVTPELVAAMTQLEGATVQVSPHFLAEVLDERRDQLHVLPPVGDASARAALNDILLERIDVVASDHNAPVAGNEGPGLDAADLFLPALLTVAAEQGWPLDALLAKVTTTPSTVFDTAGRLVDGRVVVDPTWSAEITAGAGQEARRIPYVGTTLSHRVVAIASEDELRFV